MSKEIRPAKGHHEPVDEGNTERSVLDLIGGIKNGTTDPKQLTPADRCACVAHLTGEGFSVAEIAKILKRSERTVIRDRKAIAEGNALSHDPGLANLMAGRLVSEAELCISRIRRVTRDRDTPPAVKVDGERACFQIVDAKLHRLQTLGYLPTAVQRVEADLTHHSDALPEYDEIQLEIHRLKEIGTSFDSDSSAELEQLAQLTVQARSSQGCDPEGDHNGEKTDDCTD